MTTVLVTGGTGNLGRSVVAHLRSTGQTVRIASRRERPADPAEFLADGGDGGDGGGGGIQWATVDYRSRAGLDEALQGADVVLHCAGGSTRAEAETMAALLSSGKRARIAHLVQISIVGIEDLPLDYYRAKLTAEKSLIASGLPWTILRATQFHDLALSLTKAMCRLPVALIPKGVPCQPVSVDEVAVRLVGLAAKPPQGRAPDFGGPDTLTFDEMAAMFLRSIRRAKRVIQVPIPGRLASALRAGHGLTPEHADGMQTFAQFLALGGG